MEAAAFKFTELSFFISKLSTTTLTCNMRTQVSEVPNPIRGSLGDSLVLINHIRLNSPN